MKPGDLVKITSIPTYWSRDIHPLMIGDIGVFVQQLPTRFCIVFVRGEARLFDVDKLTSI